jgi:hypothetical protein
MPFMQVAAASMCFGQRLRLLLAEPIVSAGTTVMGFARLQVAARLLWKVLPWTLEPSH